MAVTFGAFSTVKNKSTGSTTWALIESIDIGQTVQIALSRDAAGDVDAWQTSGKEQTVKVTMLYDAASPPPEAGGYIYVGAKTYLVDSVTITQRNTDFTRAEVSGKYWPTNNKPENE